MFVQQCFDEVERAYDETSGREKKLSREDWAHGSLLITIELLRCSNVAAEVVPTSYLCCVFHLSVEGDDDTLAIDSCCLRSGRLQI